MLVMKFGGSSVADLAQIEKVLEIVRGRKLRKPVVVSSAHKGITNALVQAAHSAVLGRDDPSPIIDRQRQIAESLGCADDLLAPFYNEIRDLLRGISLVKELSPRSLDYISSFGERMSVRCLADFFTRKGLPAQAYDVWDLGFITDDAFGQARPLPGYEETMREAFAALGPETIPVVTGFVGKNKRGEITTVGRNGSDLTASLIAAALGAEEVEIWTDTDGVMSADPSVVRSARNIPTMHFDEAAELAYFGSRVLHPSTLLPAMGRGIPVRVLNTNRPEHPGTVIEEGVRSSEKAVTSIAYKERQVVMTLSSTRMFGRAGYLAPIFEILGRHGIVVDMIATSEVAVSLTTDNIERARSAATELSEWGELTIQEGKTILAVVGLPLAERPGIASQILAAIAGVGVNVEMISYASGSINLGMVIDDDEIDRVVPVLHRMLFE